MANLLYRLGKTAYRRWPVFLIGWLVALVAAGGIAQAVQKPMVDSFTIPGIPSLQAQDMQKKLFPDTPDALNVPSVTVVVAAPEGHKLSEPTYVNATNALAAELQKVEGVPKTAKIVNPVMAAPVQTKMLVEQSAKQGIPQPVAEANAKVLSPLSPDQRVGTMQFAFDAKDIQSVKQASRDGVNKALDNARKAGLTAEVQGSGMEEMPEMGGASELIGLAVAGLVLMLTFGSLVAAGMPLVTAIVGVASGTLALLIATGFTEVGTMTPTLASMIGLAVGIDYTLFILSRYRSELAHTDDRAEAAGLAVGRAGSAVVFAGLTVLIALLALSVVGIPFLTAMGMAAAGTVFFAVMVALTLLPAILGMLKGKAFAGRVIKVTTVREDDTKFVNGGVRWANGIAKQPLVIALLVVIGLGALAVPAKDLHLALPTDSTAAKSTTNRKAADLIAGSFGPGRNAPLVAVIDGTKLPADPKARIAAYGQITQWAAKEPGVVNAQLVGVNKDMSGAQMLVTPSTGPADKATDELLTKVRDDVGNIEKQTQTTIGITGVTAIQADVSDKLTEALPIYLAVVVGLAFILLMLVFRSILVPLTATLGFLLSILATIGATVLVFQKGLFGIMESEPLVSFLPIMLIGIVFGLAMDYQVFLVTRMREGYVHGDTAHEAVVDGFRHGARVVAAAAAIMISVFGAFIMQDLSFIKAMGFALAIAVFFDAFIVRMTLIPALMYLMGDAAWKLPKWLDKILPNVDVEGESLARHGKDNGNGSGDALGIGATSGAPLTGGA